MRTLFSHNKRQGTERTGSEDRKRRGGQARRKRFFWYAGQIVYQKKVKQTKNRNQTEREGTRSGQGRRKGQNNMRKVTEERGTESLPKKSKEGYGGTLKRNVNPMDNSNSGCVKLTFNAQG